MSLNITVSSQAVGVRQRPEAEAHHRISEGDLWHTRDTGEARGG